MCSLRVLFGIFLAVAMSLAVTIPVHAQDGGMDLDIIKDLPPAGESAPGAAPAEDLNPLDRDFATALEAYRERDYIAAREMWGDLTDAGHGLSMHNLAVLKWRGQGGPREREQALELFRNAGQNDVPQSLHALGVLSLRGAGVPPDPAEAVRYFEAASALDHPPSTYNLALAHLKGIGGAGDRVLGMELMAQAAEGGLARAQYDLGTLLYNGTYGSVDKDAARVWFERAAEGGDAFGYYNLALMQFAGEGGPADPELAVINLTEAAEMGAVPAQLKLAHLMATGDAGVPKDPAGAYVWFTVAGAFGAENALLNAKRIAQRLTDGQLKRAKQAAASFTPKQPPAPEAAADAAPDAPRTSTWAPPNENIDNAPAAPGSGTYSDKDAKAAEDLLKTLQ